jgi:hypothetical protein
MFSSRGHYVLKCLHIPQALNKLLEVRTDLVKIIGSRAYEYRRNVYLIHLAPNLPFGLPGQEKMRIHISRLLSSYNGLSF